MNAERWRRVKKVLEVARELPVGERDAYLDKACGSDPGLRGEVESLIAHGAQGSELRTDSVPAKALAPDMRLGPYRIVSPLGAGGMGEVYKATDTRLGRTVAIKVLPAHLSENPELRARFEREARAVSSLSHPNICTLYDVGHQDGVDFLVMEYLEGETIAQRLERGALPLDEALELGAQIAEALAIAHRGGVVHRDLKPGNIMLTPSGPKLLDFGLAKLQLGRSTTDVEGSEPPTAQAPLTAPRVVMGTFPYAAPEQLEGAPVDSRADIFSLGAVLYEMVTGKRAFPGDSPASVIAAVLGHEPESVSELEPSTPAALEWVIRSCLVKDPAERWQSAWDLGKQLRWIRHERHSTEATHLAESRNPWAGRFGWAVAGVLAMILGAQIVRKTAPTESRLTTAPARFSLELQSSVAFTDLFGNPAVAVSSESKRIVFTGFDESTSTPSLYVRALNRLENVQIEGTEGARQPFFSPNGASVVFTAGGDVKTVSIDNGVSSTIGSAASMMGAAWLPDGRVIIAPDERSALVEISADGRSARAFTQLDDSRRELSHRWPVALPDGAGVLFAVGTSENWDEASIAVADSRTGEHRTVLEGGSYPRYAGAGYLLFVRGGDLLAAPFELATLEVTGLPSRVVGGVESNSGIGSAQYDVADDGTLVYFPSTNRRFGRLTWVDRDGKPTTIPGGVRSFETPRLSPDGQRIAVTLRDENPDIWVYDLQRGNLARLTFDEGEDESPVWTPDGTRITYASSRGEQRLTLQQKADGSDDEEETVLVGNHDHHHLGGWTPDGRTLAWTDLSAGTYKGSTGYDIWLGNPEETDRSDERLQASMGASDPALSPDGRWIAYVSAETGRNEIFVRSLSSASEKHQISTEGGTEPAWSRATGELFYRDGDRMMVVDVDSRNGFAAGTPRVLFEGRYARLPWNARNYDVSADGRRFLMIEPDNPRDRTDLVVLLNWVEELQRSRQVTDSKR